MKKLSVALVLTALTLPASGADKQSAATQACTDAGFDSGAIDHFMGLIKNERSNSGPIDTDSIHAWGEQVKCYSARLTSVAVAFKQQTGGKFVVEKTCGAGVMHQAYADGYAAGSSPGPTCKQ